MADSLAVHSEAWYFSLPTTVFQCLTMAANHSCGDRHHVRHRAAECNETYDRGAPLSLSCDEGRTERGFAGGAKSVVILRNSPQN